jgi:threonine/homoserine/homoserine lactone efflux protein
MTAVDVFVISFLLAVPAGLSPGPLTTTVVALGARQGVRVGPLVTHGHALTEFLMVLALALGFGSLMGRPVVAGLIGLVGGALMLFMGLSLVWGIWRGTISLPRAVEVRPAVGAGSMFVLGVVASVSSPFWFGWWVGVAGPCVVEARRLGWAVVMLFFLGHIIVDYGWQSFLAGVVGSGRRWINDTSYRVLLGAASLFLLYIGLMFLLRAAGIFGLPFGITSEAGTSVCSLGR